MNNYPSIFTKRAEPKYRFTADEAFG